MKKLLFSLLIIAVSVAAYAQGQHLTFKNIPIDGSLTKCVNALKNAGYELKYQDPDGVGAIMEGSFTNQKATVAIITTPQSKTVWKIAVLFEDQNSWYSLKGDYLILKANLTTKYGQPEESFEFFSSPYEEGDGYEMTAIYAEKCHYTSFFAVKSSSDAFLGEITIEISKNETKGRVILSYEDAANTELMKKEKESVVYDDL